LLRAPDRPARRGARRPVARVWSRLRRGARDANSARRRSAERRRRQGGRVQAAALWGPPRPAPGAFDPWPRASASTALAGRTTLSAFARPRRSSTRPGRARPPPAGRRALTRRRPETGNPEPSPWRSGELSADQPSRTARGPEGHRARRRPALSDRVPPTAMPPHVTTPHERAPSRAGCEEYRIFFWNCQEGVRGIQPYRRRQPRQCRGCRSMA
jgi:hypothetical protein